MKKKSVALITGAARGIGQGIVLELVKNGFDVAGVDIIFNTGNKQTGLLKVKACAKKFNREFFPIKGDISFLEDHDKILRDTLNKFGKIDLLVNNAGIAPEERLDILETTPDSFDRVLAVNTRGTFFLTQKVARQMIEQVKKHQTMRPCIIFISSISAYVSSPSRAEYCLSKAALSQAARIFADRLAEHGINVYEVRPGIVQTDMTSPVKEKYDKLIKQGLIPQNRWGFPDDVAKAVIALAKGYFDYSTGLVVEVSGGMNISRL